jgi:glycosyltransferase involved in cell wall biosynthesis
LRGKGQLELLHCLDNLPNSDLKIQLILLGKIADPEYYDRCNEIIKKLGDQQNISITVNIDPAQDDINVALYESHCFVLLSSYPNEGQPAVLIEAMSYGLQIVTTDWGGITDMVPDTAFIHSLPISKEAIVLSLERLRFLVLDQGYICQTSLDFFWKHNEFHRWANDMTKELIGHER